MMTNNSPLVEVIEGIKDTSRIINNTNCKVWEGKDGIVLVLKELGNIMVNVKKNTKGYERIEKILYSGENEIHRKSNRLLKQESEGGHDDE